MSQHIKMDRLELEWRHHRLRSVSQLRVEVRWGWYHTHTSLPLCILLDLAAVPM